MKKIIWLLGTIIVSMSCNPKNNFWTIKEVKLQDYQEIHAILSYKKNECFIGGTNRNGKPTNQNFWSPYIKKYSNDFSTVKEITEFDCKTITDIYATNSYLIAEGIELGNTAHKTTKYFYNPDKQTWQKIKLPERPVAYYLYEITNEKSYLCGTSVNQFGITFYRTQDGGNTWKEQLVLMPNKKDGFWEHLFTDGKLWGVRGKHPNTQKELSLLYIDTKTWELSQEIDLSEEEDVIEIKAFDNNIYLLSQIGLKGYIKRVNQEKKELEVVSEFSLAKQVGVSYFYLYKDYQIVVTLDMNTFLPNHNLLYKKVSSTVWQKENFPKLTYSSICFDNGRLIGISDRNKIYYHDFE